MMLFESPDKTVDPDWHPGDLFTVMLDRAEGTEMLPCRWRLFLGYVDGRPLFLSTTGVYRSLAMPWVYRRVACVGDVDG